MSKKESAFVSAVVYSNKTNEETIKFVNNVRGELREHFNSFEVVVVDNCSPDVNELSREFKCTVAEKEAITIVHMSEKQGFEECLRAGVDVAIGDFVYEFEDLEYNFETDCIWKAYEKAQEGFDIVSVEKLDNTGSRHYFYNLINKYSITPVDMHATLFRLVSRRAINRVISLDLNVDWRTAAYAGCGLKSSSIAYESSSSKTKNRDIFLAIDCFLLYTNLPKYCGITMALCSFFFCFLGFAMSLIVAPWAQMFFKIVVIAEMFVLSVLFTLVLFETLLYMRNSTTRKKYLISGIEKIQRTK